MKALIAAAALVLAGCAGSTKSLGLTKTPLTFPCCTNKTPVTFQYLGNGGWVIRRGEEAILTAPFFTNPGLLRVGTLRTLRPSQSAVDRGLRDVKLDDVRGVLAGHAHYDHLLDMPLVFDKLPRGTKLYGGDTAGNELCDLTRFESVTARAGTRTARGQWIPIGKSIRVMPILSEHAAHFHGIKAFNGHVDNPVCPPPRTANHWREGETLAFLIDFMDGDRVDLRVYYDDAAHNSPYGYPDDETLREHAVDVAILCAASWQETADYPHKLIDLLHPSRILLGHWEDFFTPTDRKELTVRFTDVRGLYTSLHDATVPTRGQIITIAPKP